MIGRRREQKELLRAFESKQSEFVALYGRRRVGKTFLVNELFNGQFAFRATGIEGGSKREQLDLFREELKRQGLPKCPRLTSWIAAFSRLEDLLEASGAKKKVVFLDELPWFDTPCAGFLHAPDGRCGGQGHAVGVRAGRQTAFGRIGSASTANLQCPAEISGEITLAVS